MLATAFLLSLLQLIVIHCCSSHSDIQVPKPKVKHFTSKVLLLGIFVCLWLCLFFVGWSLLISFLLVVVGFFHWVGGSSVSNTKILIPHL